MLTDDIRIGVLNEGPFEPVFFYNGKSYTYEVSKPGNSKPSFTVVPYEVAHFHWAIDIDEAGNITRSTKIRNGEKESWLNNRISCLCPKKNVSKNPEKEVYTDDPEWKDWFLNKIHFRIKRLPNRMQMSAEEFSRI